MPYTGDFVGFSALGRAMTEMKRGWNRGELKLKTYKRRRVRNILLG
jgi:hypothetical protein